MSSCDVVIAGSGIAGMEGLLRLVRLARGQVSITVLSPAEEFVHRSLTVLEPFRRTSLGRYPLPGLIGPTGAVHLRHRLVQVDPDFRLVRTNRGRELHYDALLVAVGARQSNPYPHAALFTDRNGGRTFASILAEVEAGRVGSIALVVPDGQVWSLPLYELALLTAHHARREAIALRLTVATSEHRPLVELGAAASDAVTQLLLDAGVELCSGVTPSIPAPGRLVLGDAERHVDKIVTLPRLIGPGIRGLPASADWFIPIDEYCRVPDTEGRVFAAGDATSFTIKHGGVGAHHADLAAAGIAHLARAGPPPEQLAPVIRATLLTGAKPLYLTAEAGRGSVWESRIDERSPWRADEKVMADELGPYLSAVTRAPDIGATPLHDCAAVVRNVN